MLVSVVLPIYNGQKYISDCIESILNQSWENLEIIVSDDNSNNNETWDKIKQINDSRIHLLKNDSGSNGIFGNLNNAINNCKGDLIQIFCQDDVMYRDYIENQVKLLEKWPEAGMVFSQFDYITSNNTIFPLEKRYDIRKKWPEFIHAKDNANYLLTYGCMPGNLSPVMLKKSVIEKIGSFNQYFNYAGDFEYWSRVAGNYAFAYNNKSNLAVRRHKNQASSTLKKEYVFKDRLYIYQSLMQKQSIKRSSTFLQWYLNQEVGSQQLYIILKSVLKNGTQDINLIKYLSEKPFSIIKSLITLCITFNGRKKIFKLKEKDFLSE